MESTVHPAMQTQPYPSSILIVRGAKEVVKVQATLTEALHHKLVEKLHICCNLYCQGHLLKCVMEVSLATALIRKKQL